MQKSHRNILIATVIGAAIVGGLLATNGNLFQGFLRVNKQSEISSNAKSPIKDIKNVQKLADCSRQLIYDSENENYDFGDLWNTVNLDLRGDDQTNCAYQILAFNDIDQNDGMAYICADSSMKAKPAEGEGSAAMIVCRQIFNESKILSTLNLSADNLYLSTSYGVGDAYNGNVYQYINTNQYSVYRVPHDWYLDPSEG